MPRWLIWLLVAVVLVAAGVWGGVTLYHQATYGSRYAEQQREAKASVGDLFTLVVPDRGPSIGDSWTASILDQSMVTQERSELVAENLRDRFFGAATGGGGGDRLITFRAEAPGTTQIVLTNCYRGCATAENQAESRSVSWNVTVER
jgi:Chagasin family peptidase inhibitor I42